MRVCTIDEKDVMHPLAITPLDSTMRLFLLSSLLAFGLSPAFAATLAPPMLDISHQCEIASGKNVTAMSECVVAESIARSDLLRHWDKLADNDVRICLKANQKAKRRPYSMLAKCLSVTEAGDPKAVPAAGAEPKK